MAFKDTDKILVNRDGVDYQADIGPLVNDDIDTSDFVSKTEEEQQSIASQLNIGAGSKIKLKTDGEIYTSKDAKINGLTVGKGPGGSGTNAVLGSGALNSGSDQGWNVAVGQNALNKCTGQGNTGIGRYSFFGMREGNDNVGVGSQVFGSLTTGSNNIGMGFCNGYYAPVFDPTTHSNRLVMGHTKITHAYVRVAWTVTSDARDKMNFAPVPYGLDFVNQLKPTAFQFKVDRDTETPNGDVRYGFKAQDILALEGDNPVIIDTEDADHLKYKGEHLVPVLVNAVQELTAMVKELQTEIAILKGA